jgi:hypothetical protein
MFGPSLEPDWVNDSEWEEEITIECENEVTSHPEGVECSEDYCAPEDGHHFCGFSGEVNASCVGQGQYTAYYTCPRCGTGDEREMDSRE